MAISQIFRGSRMPLCPLTTARPLRCQIHAGLFPQFDPWILLLLGRPLTSRPRRPRACQLLSLFITLPLACCWSALQKRKAQQICGVRRPRSACTHISSLSVPEAIASSLSLLSGSCFPQFFFLLRSLLVLLVLVLSRNCCFQGRLKRLKMVFSENFGILLLLLLL